MKSIEKTLTPGVAKLLETIRKCPGQTAEAYAKMLGWQPLTVNSYSVTLVYDDLVTIDEGIEINPWRARSAFRAERYYPVEAPTMPQQEEIVEETVGTTLLPEEAIKTNPSDSPDERSIEHA